MSNPLKRTLQMTSLLFGITILFCYIAWSLGYEGFIIVGNIELPLWALHVITAVLFIINFSLYAGFVLNDYTWKVLYFSIPMMVLNKIGVNLFSIPAEMFTGILPILIFGMAIIWRKTGRWAWIRLIVLNVSVFIWNWVTSMISAISLSVHISVYQSLRLSISAILLMLLLYSIGGAQNAGRLERMVFPGFLKHDSKRSSSNPQSVDGIPVSSIEKLVMRSVIAFVQVLQWMLILWVCNLDNLFLDALVITTSFICHGMIINTRKHLKPIILCTLAATIIFYIAARFTISFQYSQFFPIVVGLALVYTMYRVSYQVDKAAERKAKKELEKIRGLEAQMDEAWTHIDYLS